MLIYHSENPRVFKNYAKSRVPSALCSRIEITKPRRQHICLQHGLLNSLSILSRPTAQKRFFQNVTTEFDKCTSGHLRVLMEMYNEMNVMLGQLPFCSPWIKEYLTLDAIKNTVDSWKRSKCQY